MNVHVDFVLRMQSDSPHYNEGHSPIDKNFPTWCATSEVLQPPMAVRTERAGSVGTFVPKIIDARKYPFTAHATAKANTAGATKSNIATTQDVGNEILAFFDEVLSLDASDEEIDSFMEDAMIQDDDMHGACHNCDLKANPSQSPPGGEIHVQVPTVSPLNDENIDAKIQHQEGRLIAVVKKSAESRVAIQRLGILSRERVDAARKTLQVGDPQHFSSATHLLQRTCKKDLQAYHRRDNKDEAVCYDSIIAAARMVLHRN